ncbi:hypothetical protein [Streptomyces sp. KLOTTS4A1]|uniref:hypothetical protein n=1 Tax=Streptomyces sp. KLOTTS4A1 TaxID=3390996 RepID=UPI0039F44C88
MAETTNGLLIVAAVALIVLHQVKARPPDEERRWWVVPVVLALVAPRKPDLLATGQTVPAGTLLALDLLLYLAVGSLLARTAHVERAEDGTVRSRGTRLTLAVRAGGITVRAGLYDRPPGCPTASPHGRPRCSPVSPTDRPTPRSPARSRSRPPR